MIKSVTFKVDFFVIYACVGYVICNIKLCGKVWIFHGWLNLCGWGVVMKLVWVVRKIMEKVGEYNELWKGKVEKLDCVWCGNVA